MPSMIIRRAGLAVLAGGALTGGVVGCGAPAAPPAAPPAASQSQHNEQDAMFAQMMIPHHQQAITMSEHELAVGTDPAVKDLAGQIEQAQNPEILTMRGWLTGWHAPAVPDGMTGHHQGHGGMMSPQQMTDFQQSRGEQTDHLFLQMMIQHHQGAVDMARSEQQQGRAPQAKQLATSIVDSQQAQIAQMQHMLDH